MTEHVASSGHFRSAAPGDLDLVVVIEVFATGGAASLYSAVVAAATQEGLRVAVVGRAGPAASSRDWGGAHLVEVEEWNSKAVAQVLAVASRSARVVWQAAPPTLPVLLATLPRSGLSIVIHGSAEVTATWFGPTRVAVLDRLLRVRPTIAVLAPSDPVADELAALLDTPRERFGILTHVSPARPRGAGSTRPRERVVVPTRLSPEKRFNIIAGAELAKARGVPLVVVGEGSDADWVEEFARGSEVEVDLVQDADIHHHIAVDDVVVAVGLVALEAALYCGAVVVASRQGALLDVVRPSTVGRMHEINFLGGPTDATDPSAVWQDVDRLTEADREQVRSSLRQLARPGVAVQQLLAACDSDSPSDDGALLPDLLHATVMAWLEAAEADRGWIAHLVEGRDWLIGHRADLEGWVGELERMLDEQRRRADGLERRLLEVARPDASWST